MTERQPCGPLATALHDIMHRRRRLHVRVIFVAKPVNPLKGRNVNWLHDHPGLTYTFLISDIRALALSPVNYIDIGERTSLN